ncbi:UDP-N-acetylmuramoyl-L-alanyl-D-glutamate--2,6-diaminopimelate ligase [Candidatus Hepatincolaceae symbiont of Richtersius coronifer]
MKISELFLQYAQAKGDLNINLINNPLGNHLFQGLKIHSSSIQTGDIFIAIIGNNRNGLDFIKEALSLGAILCVIPQGSKEQVIEKIIEQDELQNFSKDTLLISLIEVKDTRDFVAYCSFNITDQFNYTPLPKNIITVTGTNGKSSVSFFVGQYLTLLKIPNIVMGTLGIFENNKKITSSLTTPDATTIAQYLRKAYKNGIDFVIIESSSHGIEQKRIEGLNFVAAGFTNLTPDHLDYHQNMDNYYQAKKRLFSELVKTYAIINIDDFYGKKLNKECKDQNLKILTYGKQLSILQIIKIEQLFNETKSAPYQLIHLKYQNKIYKIELNLSGDFQVYNIVCALGLLLACGFSLNNLANLTKHILEIQGRLNLIKQDFIKAKIFVDFAHTPNALEQVLLTLKKENHKKLRVVFGCGGDRDRLKRPQMGEIAYELADAIYITDDNPRTENPETIRNEIIQGITLHSSLKPKPLYNIANRAEAILKAVADLQVGDILLIAGKGHENTQIIGDQSVSFSDNAEVEKSLLKIYGDINEN